MIYIFKSLYNTYKTFTLNRKNNLNYVENECSIPSLLDANSNIGFNICQHTMKKYDDNLAEKGYITLGYSIGGVPVNVRTCKPLITDKSANGQTLITEDVFYRLTYDETFNNYGTNLINETEYSHSGSISSPYYNIYNTNRYVQLGNDLYKYYKSKSTLITDICREIKNYDDIVASTNNWFLVSNINGFNFTSNDINLKKNYTMSDKSLYTSLLPINFKILYKDPDCNFIIYLMLGFNNINGTYDLSKLLKYEEIQYPRIYLYDFNINYKVVELKKLSNKEYINLGFNIVLDKYNFNICNISANTSNLIAMFIGDEVTIWRNNNKQTHTVPLQYNEIIIKSSNKIYGNYLYLHILNLYTLKVSIIAYDINLNEFIYHSNHYRANYDYDINLILNRENEIIDKIPSIKEVNKCTLFDYKNSNKIVRDINDNKYSCKIINGVLIFTVNEKNIYTKTLNNMKEISHYDGGYDLEENCIRIVAFDNIQNNNSANSTKGSPINFNRNTYMISIVYNLETGEIKCSEEGKIDSLSTKLYLNNNRSIYPYFSNVPTRYDRIAYYGYIKDIFNKNPSYFDINNLYSTIMIKDSINSFMNLEQLFIEFIYKQPFYIYNEKETEIVCKYKVHNYSTIYKDYKITVFYGLRKSPPEYLKKISYNYKNSQTEKEENTSKFDISIDKIDKEVHILTIKDKDLKSSIIDIRISSEFIVN